MSVPFVGEIRLCGYNFAPAGWVFCDGQLLPISEYDALFALLGTTYGGDGQTTFAVPDLRNRIVVGLSSDEPNLGTTGGVDTIPSQGAVQAAAGADAEVWAAEQQIDNRPPHLRLAHIISLFGIFPSQS